MKHIAHTPNEAMEQITSLEDLRALAAQREIINAIYAPAARKMNEEGHSTRQIAEAYGINRSTAHVLIKSSVA
jgi:DNA invertase Pin-like site-specific DNA recombinase